MTKLPSSYEVIKFLEKNGFKKTGQKGSHCKYRKEQHVVIIPHPRKKYQ